MSENKRWKSLSAFGLAAILPPAALLCTACGGGGGTTAASPAVAVTAPVTAPSVAPSTSPASGAVSYAAAYKAAKWSSAVTVGFPDACTMTLATTGVPPYHADYYLGPVSSQNPTSVAATPVTHMELAVYAYDSSNIAGASTTFNVCPAKAAITTATGLGPIGYTLAGEALFNPYEANGSTPALTDNVSYTFTTSAGKVETASFIDGCNSHAAGGPGSATWHYHAVPSCLTAQLDGAGGPSHLLGIALDGFPIYGGRDVNGNAVQVTQLDACNGITSPTPEFPGGVYHYVLPIGVTGKQSSLNCYAGTVSRTQLAAVQSTPLCGMAASNARLQAAARARRLRAAHRLEVAGARRLGAV
jgi:YHYH protein